MSLLRAGIQRTNNLNGQLEKKHSSRNQIATIIAIVLHVVGLAGILLVDSDFIIRCTSYNLLICFGLLIWTQRDKNKAFLLFTVLVCILGFIVEIVGVNTGLVFGKYSYGAILGPKLFGVPFIIGINWFIVIYCSGIATQKLLMTIVGKNIPSTGPPKMIKVMALVVDGATIATFFDWLMEPSVTRLEFWHWLGDGSIPVYNYICWFVTSMLFLTIFKLCKFRKHNKFAINLLLIQIVFFLILRIYLDN